MADWQPGDLALCIRDGEITRAGRVYTVVSVIPAGTTLREDLRLYTWSMHCLRLKGVSLPPGWASESSRFRKITPGTEPEGIEEPRRVPVKEVEHG